MLVYHFHFNLFFILLFSLAFCREKTAEIVEARRKAKEAAERAEKERKQRLKLEAAAKAKAEWEANKSTSSTSICFVVFCRNGSALAAWPVLLPFLQKSTFSVVGGSGNCMKRI